MSDDLTAVFRREAGPCTATLIRVLGDVDVAEDAVAEAFTIAAERWPREGVPANPGGWIMTTARRRAIDRLRRESSRDQRHRAAHALTEATAPDHGTREAEVVDELDALAAAVPDDQLRLMFLCCHPALSADARVALTLRLLGGLTTEEIARAFLVSTDAMAARIVRAKRKLRDNHAPYRIPTEAELPERLDAVLHAIALVFTEGHTATSGDDLARADLTALAIHLGRVLAALMPDEPEVLGLLALMLLTEARRPARTGEDGSYVRLSDQDRSRWDRTLVAEGHALVRACLRRGRPGPFQVQAAIAAVHADAPDAASTDWGQVVALYDQLVALRPDAVVAMHRAIAIGERDGADAGLAALDALDAAGLAGYQPYHAARADLLARTGAIDAARDAYDRAIALTTNVVEERFLTGRRDQLPRIPGG